MIALLLAAAAWWLYRPSQQSWHEWLSLQATQAVQINATSFFEEHVPSSMLKFGMSLVQAKVLQAMPLPMLY